jgi:hypothetical protein
VTVISERRTEPLSVAPRRALDWLTDEAPARRLEVVRVVTVLYGVVWVAVRTDHWRDLSVLPVSRWRPVGILGWFGGPPSTTAVTVVAVATIAVGMVALTGWRWAFAGPVFAGGFLWLTTFGASWGQILHTEHLAALHLLVLAAAPTGRGASRTTGWPLRIMTLVTIGTYVVAGLAKFRFGGGLGWLDGDRLLRLVAHDNLRKRLLGDPFAPFARYVVGHPLLFRLGVWLTLVVELGAPLALLGRRLRYSWIAMAWTFHVVVLATMAVLFPYPLTGVAFASMLPMERLAARFSRAGTPTASTAPGYQR